MVVNTIHQVNRGHKLLFGNLRSGFAASIVILLFFNYQVFAETRVGDLQQGPGSIDYSPKAVPQRNAPNPAQQPVQPPSHQTHPNHPSAINGMLPLIPKLIPGAGAIPPGPSTQDAMDSAKRTRDLDANDGIVNSHANGALSKIEALKQKAKENLKTATAPTYNLLDEYVNLCRPYINSGQHEALKSQGPLQSCQTVDNNYKQMLEIEKKARADVGHLHLRPDDPKLEEALNKLWIAEKCSQRLTKDRYENEKCWIEKARTQFTCSSFYKNDFNCAQTNQALSKLIHWENNNHFINYEILKVGAYGIQADFYENNGKKIVFDECMNIIKAAENSCNKEATILPAPKLTLDESTSEKPTQAPQPVLQNLNCETLLTRDACTANIDELRNHYKSEQVDSCIPKVNAYKATHCGNTQGTFNDVKSNEDTKNESNSGNEQ